MYSFMLALIFGGGGGEAPSRRKNKGEKAKKIQKND